MNILLLNYEYPPLGGGAGNAVYYILNEFVKNNSLSIDLITSSISCFKIEQISEKIKIHFLNIGKNKSNYHFQTTKDLLIYSAKAFFYAKKLMKKNHYDLIHAFFGIPCGYIAMKLKLPYIVSLRGSDVPYYNERFKLLDKLIFQQMSKKIWNKASYVIANSEGLKKLALETNPSQKINIIYNGIDTKKFKPLLKKRKTQELTIISTGRLIQRKGYYFLLKALEGIKNIKLQLIGDGNLKDELTELSLMLGVNTEFLGKKKREEIINFLQNADIFVLPSLNEGMSNSLLEAMACGLPVIATDVGGSKELIKNNGFIVRKGSAVSLKKAIGKYINNQKLLIEHGRQSRKASFELSWHNIAINYLNYYKNI